MPRALLHITNPPASAVTFAADSSRTGCAATRRQTKKISSHFGLRQSSVAQRAATMLRAGGFNDDTYIVRLGSPDYLVAGRRRRIIRMRESYRQLAEEMS